MGLMGLCGAPHKAHARRKFFDAVKLNPKDQTAIGIVAQMDHVRLVRRLCSIRRPLAKITSNPRAGRIWRVRVYCLVIRTNWQRELKDGASGRVCLRPQPSSVSFDNRTADQQSHSKALRLRRIEGIEKTVESARIQACTRISYCNQYMGSCSASRAFTGELAFVRFIRNLSNLL